MRMGRQIGALEACEHFKKHSGSIVGAFREHFGSILDVFLVILEVLGALGGSWGLPGSILATSWPQDLIKWSPRRGQDGFWEDFGRQDGFMLGSFWGDFPIIFRSFFTSSF